LFYTHREMFILALINTSPCISTEERQPGYNVKLP
jgi:hypothetical protein